MSKFVNSISIYHFTNSTQGIIICESIIDIDTIITIKHHIKILTYKYIKSKIILVEWVIKITLKIDSTTKRSTHNNIK